MGYPIVSLGKVHGISHRQAKGFAWRLGMYMGYPIDRLEDTHGISHGQAGGCTWDIPQTA
jgi:hypothetical protein